MIPLLMTLLAAQSAGDIRCDTACRMHGYAEGHSKGKYCKCVDDYLLEDLVAKPFKLQKTG